MTMSGSGEGQRERQKRELPIAFHHHHQQQQSPSDQRAIAAAKGTRQNTGGSKGTRVWPRAEETGERTSWPAAIEGMMSVEEMKPIFEGSRGKGSAGRRSPAEDEPGGQPPRERANGLCAFSIALNFVKGMLGPGCLSIPLIFQQAGLLTGFLLLALFGLVSTKCMVQLVNCSQHLSKKKRHQFLDYGDVAFEACAHSFPAARSYREMARVAVNASIVSLQVGICSVSVVFIAAHLKEILEELFASSLSDQHWIVLVAMPLVLINFIRSLHRIVLLSIIGSLLMFSALAIIFQHLLRADHVPIGKLPLFTNIDGMLSASGAILYAFEGQAMVLPLENRLRHPSQMGGPCGILSCSMSFVFIIYAVCGLAGYATYGENVQGSIALNLPAGQMLFTSVRLMLTLVVFLGFVMQQYVIVEMLWPKLSGAIKWANECQLFVWEMVFRASLVLLSVLIAYAVPNLAQIIPLVGMSAGMLLAIVFPSLLDTLTFLPADLEQGNLVQPLMRLLQNGLFTLIGFTALIGGVKVSLMELIGRTAKG